jgi:hypothetical protein
MLGSHLEMLATRRSALGLAALTAGAVALPGAAAAAAAPRKRRTLDFRNPADHLLTYIKMSASEEEGVETYLVYEGTTFGVTDGTDLRPLYGMLGFSPVRTFRQPDGSWRILGSEASVFTDLDTGKVLGKWRNPYINRDVDVWHLRTGPINFPIDPKKPISTGGWGLLRPSEYGTNGFFMPIKEQGKDLIIPLDAQANRKNPLDPAIWRHESTGPKLRYSEHNTWRVRRSDIENPDIPSPEIFASWHTIKEWRPWMLMGQRPGNIYNHLVARKVRSVADAPRVLLDYYEKNAPEFLSAPKTWTGTYLTDWDYFQKARKPASF